MHIFIMRHGEAENIQTADRKRKLTLFGQQQAEMAGQWLNHFCQSKPIELAIVSPFERTRQTFEALKKNVLVKSFEYNEDLIPSASAELFHDFLDVELSSKPQLNNVLLVSHMPLISYLLDSLCGTQHSLLFATAAVAVIDYDVSKCKGVLHQMRLTD